VKSIRTLFLASFSGRVIFAASSLISLPLLTKILGAEAVGLIGFFTSLLMVLMVLEGGLTSSIIHKLASSVRCEQYAPARHSKSTKILIKTYFSLFLVLGLIVLLLVWMSAEIVSSQWLNFESLSYAEVVESIHCMSIFIGLNLPILVLQGVFVGREMQPTLNAIYIPYSIARTLGVVLLLQLMPSGASITTYFYIQVIVQSLYLLMLLAMLYKSIGFNPFVRGFKLVVLKKGVKFSGGVLLISITSVIAVQYDKVYLSGNVGLSDYAAYTLAATLAGVPYIFSTAFSAVLFPRFSKSYAADNSAELERVFRSAFSIIALVMSVLCGCIYWLSDGLLHIIFDAQLAYKINDILPLLIIGTALQSLSIVPFSLQLAMKWTQLAFRLNLACVSIMLVALPFLVKFYGVLGAAYMWVVYNVVSIVLTCFFLVKKLPYLSRTLAVVVRIVISMIVLCWLAFSLLDWLLIWPLSSIYLVGVQVLLSGLVLLAGAYLYKNQLKDFN
jgi:O-antigen/teichoic acid export membrane protein